MAEARPARSRLVDAPTVPLADARPLSVVMTTNFVCVARGDGRPPSQAAVNAGLRGRQASEPYSQVTAAPP
jgi:hypothetical protein